MSICYLEADCESNWFDLDSPEVSPYVLPPSISSLRDKSVFELVHSPTCVPKELTIPLDASFMLAMVKRSGNLTLPFIIGTIIAFARFIAIPITMPIAIDALQTAIHFWVIYFDMVVCYIGWVREHKFLSRVAEVGVYEGLLVFDGGAGEALELGGVSE